MRTIVYNRDISTTEVDMISKHPIMNRAGQFIILMITAMSLLYAGQASAYMNSQIGRFMQRDPIAYVDGMSVYAAYQVLRSRFDPSGMATEYGYVGCDGKGGFEAFLTKEAEKLPPCARKVILSHEQVHIVDWNSDNKTSRRCRGLKRGVRAEYNNPRWIQESEKRAYEDTYQKTQAWLDANTVNESCSECPVTDTDGNGNETSPVGWEDCCEWMKKWRDKSNHRRTHGDHRA